MATKQSSRRDSTPTKRTPPPAQQKQGEGQAADEVAAAAQARKRDTIDRQQQMDSVGQSRKPDAKEVARRAYERWQQRGGQHGNDQDDWFHAEQELKGGGGHAGGHQQ